MHITASMADTIQSPDTFSRFDPSSILEEPNQDGDVEMTMDDGQSRFIVGVDFGTTFSSVAYARLSEATQGTALRPEDVECITRYPDERSASWQPREDVPTELWYRKLTGQKRPDHMEIEPNGNDLESEHSSESDSSSKSSESESEPENQPERREEEERKSDTFFWGFGVQLQLKRTDIPKDSMKRVTRFKLMLDEKNPLTDHIRAELGTILRNLKISKLIKKDSDIISDYLTQLFTHTRDEMRKTVKLDDSVPIEFVLSIPAIWPAKACRTMQTAMATAAQRSGLGSWEKESLGNLFIVSEPEAAAACVLAEDKNDIFVSYFSNSFVEATL
jgi:hypothetical protein